MEYIISDSNDLRTHHHLVVSGVSVRVNVTSLTTEGLLCRPLACQHVEGGVFKSIRLQLFACLTVITLCVHNFLILNKTNILTLFNSLIQPGARNLTVHNRGHSINPETYKLIAVTRAPGIGSAETLPPLIPHQFTGEAWTFGKNLTNNHYICLQTWRLHYDSPDWTAFQAL